MRRPLAPGELLKGRADRDFAIAQNKATIDLSAGLAALLFLVPLIGKCHWRPMVGTPLPVQATEPRKDHVWPRDQDVLARELTQQLIPRDRGCSRVNVKYHCDVGVWQLKALYVHDVAPK